MKGYFIIDGDDFGVGSIQIDEDEDGMNIRITGDDDAFDALTGLTGDDTFAEGQWRDLMNPPEIYFEGFTGTDGALSADLNEDMLERYSFGLVLDDSCLLEGHLRVEDEHVVFKGTASWQGRTVPVSVDADGRDF